jgi:hypothetical protein
MSVDFFISKKSVSRCKICGLKIEPFPKVSL